MIDHSYHTEMFLMCDVRYLTDVPLLLGCQGVSVQSGDLLPPAAGRSHSHVLAIRFF